MSNILHICDDIERRRSMMDMEDHKTDLEVLQIRDDGIYYDAGKCEPQAPFIQSRYLLDLLEYNIKHVGAERYVHLCVGYETNIPPTVYSYISKMILHPLKDNDVKKLRSVYRRFHLAYIHPDFDAFAKFCVNTQYVINLPGS